jgi:hypothetical protein
MQLLAEMPPEEVAALPPQKREMRQRWLEGKAFGEVRTRRCATSLTSVPD